MVLTYRACCTKQHKDPQVNLRVFVSRTYFVSRVFYSSFNCIRLSCHSRRTPCRIRPS